MNAYDAYKRYVALKLHFQQKDYDYFKFSGSAKVSREKFETRNDKYFFQRIAKLYDDKQLEQLLVANFIVNKSAWIGEVLSDDGRTRYIEYKKTIQALEYNFQEDMNAIKQLIDVGDLPSFDSIFIIVRGDDWPELVTLTLHKTIRVESFIIINKILNFLPKMNGHIEDSIVWPEMYQLCRKYSPFLNVDVKRYRTIMKNIFLQKKLERVV
jgi:hypothetical protein